MRDISWGRFKLPLAGRTCIMGILNRTPDSFSDGGLYMDEDDAVGRVYEMAGEGADIIDIGGESTRPGSEPVSVDVELDRIIPVIRRAASRLAVPISVDTYKAEVAAEALRSGAAMINDISGLRHDSRMAGVAAEYDVPVVIMHMKGVPRTMQSAPEYASLIEDIIGRLRRSIEEAEEAGVDGDKIIIDPGIGFGKTTAHNLEILKQLGRFTELDKPILVGLSRKSFIANTLAERGVRSEDIEKTGRLMGTVSSAAIAIKNGANILRVHDVSMISQAAKIADAIMRSV